MRLVWPSREFLAGYLAALERGWSPDNMRGQAAADEELARIASDANAFLASLVDLEGRGEPITLPDGSLVPRLPGYRMDMGWRVLRQHRAALAARHRGAAALLPRPHRLVARPR